MSRERYLAALDTLTLQKGQAIMRPSSDGKEKRWPR